MLNQVPPPASINNSIAPVNLTCLAGFEGLSIYCFQQGGGQQVSPDTFCLAAFDRSASMFYQHLPPMSSSSSVAVM
jgi:hypothetical protein